MAVKIAENLYYVGADNPELRVFDIIMYTPFGTSYNAYLIKGEKKNILIETVKEGYYDQMLHKIDSVLSKDETIDYILHNHTEPDHSGSSYKLLNERYPNAEIIGSKTAIKYLHEIGNEEVKDMKTLAIEDLEGGKLDLGGYTLEFFHAPFLHWPDTIFTYCEELKALFTCDFLGSHYSLGETIFDRELKKDEMGGFDEAFKYYFDCIFGPFKKFAIDGLDIIDKLIESKGIEVIGTSHGPVLTDKEFIDDCMKKYRNWSVGYENTIDKNKITVVYVSAYGFTKEMAMEICKALEANGFDVKKFDVTYEDESEIAAEMMSSAGVLYGTSTILGDALANLYTMAVKYVNPILSMGQYGGSFGSYGWSGEGPGNIHQRLEQCGIKLPLEPLQVNFRASKEDIKKCYKWGDEFAKAVKKGFEDKPIDDGSSKDEVMHTWRCEVCGYEEDAVVPSESCIVCSAVDPWEDLGPNETISPKVDGVEHTWKCTICGYEEDGVEPSDQCTVCAASGDIWEDLGELKVLPKSNWDGKIAIVGGGCAGVNAALAAREVNENCEIFLFSEEGLPYNRTQLTKVDYDPIPIEDLEVYAENKINLINEKVMDIKNGILVTDDDDYEFDNLVLAVGSHAFNPYGEFDNLFTIHKKVDMEGFKALKNKKNVVIIGGGIIGMELCDLLSKDSQVENISVIELMDHVLKGYLNSDHGSSLVENSITDNDIEIYLSTQCSEFVTEGNSITGLRIENLDGKSVIDADAVIVAISTIADTSFGEKLGLGYDRSGILVDENLRTSVENIFAAGDCAFVDSTYPKNWGGAIFQGKISGWNAAGLNETCVGSPSTYSMETFGVDIMTGGKRLKEEAIFERVTDENFLRFWVDQNDFITSFVAVGPGMSRGVLLDCMGKTVVEGVKLLKKIF